MHRSRKVTAAAAALLSVGAASTALISANRTVHAQADPASRAILYLEAQQSPDDGSIPSAPGSYAASELYAIAAAADGFDPNAMRSRAGPSVMTFLATHAADACSTAGKCGELIQAAVAGARDPIAFGGLNLVTTLLSDYHSSTGAFGDGEAFTQALAVQGLVAANESVPSAALAYITANQDSDGGWSYLDVKDDPNPNDFATSDTNSTAMSLMALDAAGDHSRDSSALAWLRTQQANDGGFPYQSGSPSDPDSTALVIQGIVATGQNPDAASWVVSGRTPLGRLAAMQASNGGYTFPGNPGPDAFTTSQVPLGLLALAFPVHAHYAAGFTPAAEEHTAVRTLLYLQAQQDSSGGFTGITATYDPSELYAIGAAATGFDPKVLRHGSGQTVMQYLAAHVGDACSSAGRCGRLIQAVSAAGLNPRAFAGRDLVTTLQGFYNSTTGAFGDGEAFTQSIAIQGLVAAGASPPSRSLTFLTGAQDSDGGWDYLDVKDDPNPNDFATSDTNSTAMVLMALDAARNHSRDSSALNWLRSQQNSDGGFPYQAGSSTDPDSTALVMQAVLAAGEDPVDGRWVRNGQTPLSALVRMQDANGGYTFPGNPGPDAFTTAQVPLALERVSFPVAFGSHAFYQSGSVLSAAGPAPSPPPSSAPPPAGPPAGIESPSPAMNPHAGSATSTEPRTSSPTGAPTTAHPTPAAMPTPSGGATQAPPSSPAPRPGLGTLPTQAGGLPLLVVYLGIGLGAGAVVSGAGYVLNRRR